MGRRKIEIKAIKSKKSRIDTFHKRKVGLVKKAAELSMLCNIKMLLIFQDLSGGIFKYSTHGLFEPKEYFKDSWSSTHTEKTLSDYPDFFAKIPKKRKKKLDMVSEKAESNSSDDSESESEDDDDDTEPTSEKTNAAPFQRHESRRSIADLLKEEEANIIKESSNIGTIEDLHKILTVSNPYDASGSHVSMENQELFQTLKKPPIDLLRSRKRTVGYESKPSKFFEESANRRRTIGTQEVPRTSPQGPGSLVFGASNQMNFLHQRSEFEMVESTRPNFSRRDLLTETIHEQKEFSSSMLPMSPINKTKDDFDSFEEPFHHDAYSQNKYNRLMASNTQRNIHDLSESIVDHLRTIPPPHGYSNTVFQNPSRGDPIGALFNNMPREGSLRGRCAKEGSSKNNSGGSEQSISQQEVSKANTKEYFWMNVSRLNASSFDNSIKEEPSPEQLRRIANGAFGLEGEGSNLRLFSPIPITSMTALSRPENTDWLALYLRAQNHLQYNQPVRDSGLMDSFQSDSSILKSPKLEKHAKNL